jgi:hypothetical protein
MKFILVAVFTVISATLSVALYLSNNKQSLQAAVASNKLILVDIQTNEIIVGSLYKHPKVHENVPRIKNPLSPNHLEATESSPVLHLRSKLANNT